jgi:hypothetical protein
MYDLNFSLNLSNLFIDLKQTITGILIGIVTALLIWFSKQIYIFIYKPSKLSLVLESRRGVILNLSDSIYGNVVGCIRYTLNLNIENKTSKPVTINSITIQNKPIGFYPITIQSFKNFELSIPDKHIPNAAEIIVLDEHNKKWKLKKNHVNNALRQFLKNQIAVSKSDTSLILELLKINRKIASDLLIEAAHTINYSETATQWENKTSENV